MQTYIILTANLQEHLHQASESNLKIAILIKVIFQSVSLK